jgi:hypothetical protein
MFKQLSIVGLLMISGVVLPQVASAQAVVGFQANTTGAVANQPVQRVGFAVKKVEGTRIGAVCGVVGCKRDPNNPEHTVVTGMGVRISQLRTAYSQEFRN